MERLGAVTARSIEATARRGNARGTAPVALQMPLNRRRSEVASGKMPLLPLLHRAARGETPTCGARQANNALCAELAEKARQEMALLAEVQSAESARGVLLVQLDDKTKLALELGKRLHALSLHMSNVQDKLTEKNLLSEELTRTCELIKSESKVLQAQLSQEQSQLSATAAQHRRESSTLDELQEQLRKLRNDDTDHKLRMRQAEADAEVLQETLVTKTKEAEKHQQELNATRMETDMLVEQCREAGGA